MKAMSVPRQRLSLDRVLVAINSALIVVLVGSLAVFLLWVCYGGEYSLRCSWILGCFILGAMLVSHITVRRGVRYACLFAIPLGAAACFAMITLVRVKGVSGPTSHLVNIALVAGIWWCTQKLTRNTTRSDSADTCPDGLLRALGFEWRAAASAEATPGRGKPPADRSGRRETSAHAPRPKYPGATSGWKEEYFPTFLAAARGTRWSLHTVRARRGRRWAERPNEVRPSAPRGVSDLLMRTCRACGWFI